MERVHGDIALTDAMLAAAMQSEEGLRAVGTYRIDDDGEFVIRWARPDDALGFENMRCEDVLNNNVPKTFPVHESSSVACSVDLSDSPCRKKIMLAPSVGTVSPAGDRTSSVKKSTFPGLSIELESIKAHSKESLDIKMEEQASSSLFGGARAEPNRLMKGKKLFTSKAEAATRFVKVFNLPPDFSKEVLFYEVNRVMKRSPFADHVKAVADSTQKEDHFLLEFLSCDLACDACKKINHFDFGVPNVVFQQITEPCIEMISSNQVEVKNLPSDFSPVILLHEINRAMRRAPGLSYQNMAAAIKCSELQPAEPDFVVVTFTSPEAAADACSIEIMYDDSQLLNLELKKVKKPASKKVHVYNVPAVFSKVIVLHEINRAMKKDGKLYVDNAGKDMKAAVTCSDKHDDGYVIVEFISSDAADEACKLVCDIEYEDVYLVLVHPQTQDAPLALPADSHTSHQTHTKPIVVEDGEENEVMQLNNSSDYSPETEPSSEEDEVPGNNPELPAGVRRRSDWPTYESLVLIDSCLKFQHLLNSLCTRHVGEGWKKVMCRMYKMECFYSMRAVKKKWNELKLFSKTATSEWIPKPFMDEFLGLSPQGTTTELLKGKLIEFKKKATLLPQKKKNKNGQFYVGLLPNCGSEDLNHVFNYEMDQLLGVEYHMRKAQFEDDKTRASTLYNEIRDQFHSHGYKQITSEHCSKRMSALNDEFKRRYDLNMRTGSGSDATDWVHWDMMSHLHEGTAVLEPPRLRNLGTARSLKEHGNEVSPSNAAKGRSKLSKVSPGTSYKEKKLAIGQSMVEEMKRFNDIKLSKNSRED